MPVTSATPVKSHTGNGVTTVFPYDFRILKNTDLKVTVDGATKTLTTDYTVSGVGDSGGGNVTFVSAPANGTAIVLEGNASYDRTTDYQRSGGFDEETVDKDFDRAVILIKQLKAILDRVPQIKSGLTLTQPSLPDPVAQRFLRWKADLSGFENFDIATIGALAVSDFMKTMLDDADAAAAFTTLGISAYIQTLLNDADAATARTTLGALAAANGVATGTLDVSEALKLSGDISPAQITADQNDYAPTGFATASTLRLSTDASRNITGLAGGADGLIKLIHNIGSFNIVLKDESASSTAANRFALNADVTIAADQMALLQYDSISSRWRVIAGGSFDINGLTAETSPAVGDLVPIYDVSAAANRKMTRQNFMKWDFESAATAITTAGVTSIAHGLGAIPVEVQVFLECVTTEAGWAVGDLIDFMTYSDNGFGLNSWGCDATNIVLALSTAAIPGNNKSTGSGVGLTAANWRYRVKARV